MKEEIKQNKKHCTPNCGGDHFQRRPKKEKQIITAGEDRIQKKDLSFDDGNISAMYEQMKVPRMRFKLKRKSRSE